MFDNEGACPSCRVPGAAPVTPADEARIVADHEAQAHRKPGRSTSTGGFGHGFGIAFVTGIPGYLYGRANTKDDPEGRRGAEWGVLVHMLLLLFCSGLGLLRE